MYGIYLTGSIFMRLRTQNIASTYLTIDDTIDPTMDILKTRELLRNKKKIQEDET